MISLLTRLAQLEESGATVALATVVRATGSTPREPGARMIVHPGGEIEGTVGGGRIEEAAKEAALASLSDGRPRFIEHNLTQELGMCCGGSVSIFVEVIGGSPRLIIFGAGHVGSALTKMAAHAGFVVHVADEREALLHAGRLGEARQLHDDLQDPALPFSEDAYVMITTHDHALDQRLLERALKMPHRWVGMIGSRRKAELARSRLEHKGFDPELIKRVRSPVGLAIAAETPEEIAVSILAELVAERRGAARDSEGRIAVRQETKRR